MEQSRWRGDLNRCYLNVHLDEHIFIHIPGGTIHEHKHFDRKFYVHTSCNIQMATWTKAVNLLITGIKMSKINISELFWAYLLTAKSQSTSNRLCETIHCTPDYIHESSLLCRLMYSFIFPPNKIKKGTNFSGSCIKIHNKSISL